MSTPEACKSCKHRYNDVSEGQNCRKIDRRIHISNGDVLLWPGFAVGQAYAECQGEKREPAVLGKLAYYFGL